jgi:hypothetical protein
MFIVWEGADFIVTVLIRLILYIGYNANTISPPSISSLPHLKQLQKFFCFISYRYMSHIFNLSVFQQLSILNKFNS